MQSTFTITSTPLFSNEEKRRVLLYALKHKLQDADDEGGAEDKWMSLGDEMKRDWMEIRDAYRHWKIEDSLEVNDTFDFGTVLTDNEPRNLNEGELCEQTYQIMEEWQIENGILECHDELLLMLPENQIDSYVPVTNGGESSKSVENSKKRPLKYEDFNQEYLDILSNQSLEELELKRKESENKILYYQELLKCGKEEHAEKMRILKAKRYLLLQKVQDIDTAISQKNLKRRYKSGPI
ncbi:uncharacterized protein LOC106653489 [Trichogramma pretiosum]|uniref:uncharacterized protein LOC106653489 n=1 Tax=Trichogramma pretiosum TaxID=7493 RepID=UPI0006C9C5EC|nr:uncharacterized protein LOC106653489 [Trichogramma pretiosum]